MAAWQVLFVVPNANASAAWDIVKTALTKGGLENATKVGRVRNSTTKAFTHRAAILAMTNAQRDIVKNAVQTVNTLRVWVFDRDGVLRQTSPNVPFPPIDQPYTPIQALASMNLEIGYSKPAGI